MENCPFSFSAQDNVIFTCKSDLQFGLPISAISNKDGQRLLDFVANPKGTLKWIQFAVGCIIHMLDYLYLTACFSPLSMASWRSCLSSSVDWGSFEAA